MNCLKFSGRTDWPLVPNRLTRRLNALRREGADILDLTCSNPTHCGIPFPEKFFSFLAAPASRLYHPSPKGDPSAREAVSSIYREKGVSLSSENIFLTSSTSEAYSFLFTLLGDPGEEVLVPAPSYPLFDYLTGLHDLKAVHYPLRYRFGRWELDSEVLSKAVTEKTRALVVVHPNNPTGSYLGREEIARIKDICLDREIPLVSDEVFAEYYWRTSPECPTLAGDSSILTFSLGGLSKFLGLPQMKLGWIAATGPDNVRAMACERLEVIADTFLSVNTPVQQALPEWLKVTKKIQSYLLELMTRNRNFLSHSLPDEKCHLLAADGGWSAVLHMSSLDNEEDFVLKLLEKEHLLVYPGYFFDFEESGFLVLSLLQTSDNFQEGIKRLMRFMIQ